MEKNCRIRLFGNFQLEVNGEIVQFGRRKSQSLLAYLVLQNSPQSREKIATMLWGDSSDENARRSLRVSLTDIRKALGDEILIASRDELSLNFSHIAEIDIQTFSTLLALPEIASVTNLTDAIEIYRGNLLEGMDDEWVVPLRSTYQNKILEALGVLIEHARAQGDYPRAVEHAEKILRLDPANEKAVRYLLICLTAKGAKDLALKRFKEIQAKGNRFDYRSNCRRKPCVVIG